MLTRSVPYETATGPVTARAALHDLVMQWRKDAPRYGTDDDDDDEREEEEEGKVPDSSRADEMPALAPSPGAAPPPPPSFYLQIDSHMLFAANWDEGLLGSWRRTGNPRAVLTAYAPPPAFVGRGGDEAFLPHICRARMTMEGVPTVEASVYARRQVAPLPTAYFSAHLAFGPLQVSGWPPPPTAAASSAAASSAAAIMGGSSSAANNSWIDAAPYDPSFPQLFWGEEVMMAARLWTRGFDLYTPDGAWVAHDYDQFHMRPWKWDYVSLAASLRRAYGVLGLLPSDRSSSGGGGGRGGAGVGERFGVGEARSLEAYLELSGLRGASSRGRETAAAAREEAPWRPDADRMCRSHNSALLRWQDGGAGDGDHHRRRAVKVGSGGGWWFPR